jgi:hypothetical protein
MGNWETYSEVEAGELELAAGKQTLRLTINTDYINVDWIKFVDDSAPQSSGSVEGESSSSTTAIARPLAFEKGAAMLHCQVFDMNGHQIKSVNVMAGSVSEAWNSVKAGLMNGVYMMRVGEVGIFKVRK